MKIALGADHAGFELKQQLAKEIEELGHDVVDLGAKAYDTSSFLKTVENILGVEPVPCDPNRDQVKAMTDVFAVPLTRQ